MKPLTNKKYIGTFGENEAVEYLINNGFEIITRNYRYGRLGELDIISREKGVLVFTEVKTRSNSLYGTPAEAVDNKKQTNIKKLSLIYMSSIKQKNLNIRYDVIEVLVNKSTSKIITTDINLIRNAF